MRGQYCLGMDLDGELEHDVAGVVDTEVVPPAPDHVLDTGTLYS